MLPLTGGGLKSRLAESGELLMPAAESTRVRITVLDGWRCFSIMIVMYGHLADYSSIGYMLRFHGYGMLGVAFFFVISGFVICTVLTGEFEKSRRVSIFGFYIRRCFRILPPLILFLIAAWTLEIASPRSIAKAALFLCNLKFCDPNVDHLWSLAYEEQFYILFPIVLVLILTFRLRWFLLVLSLAWPIFIVVVLFCFKGELVAYPMWFEFLLFGAALALYRVEATRAVQRIGPIGLYVAVPLIFVVWAYGAGMFTPITFFIEFPPITYAVFASTCLKPAFTSFWKARRRDTSVEFPTGCICSSNLFC
ncbi:MAG TPA: acyltransferase [Xanthobacteraceae bacterium]|jgi:peptidoglycan/LPS O-acetylase OafA/YrhL|nr:acyltransferase [Xanthobacteraceae bacterium]